MIDKKKFQQRLQLVVTLFHLVFFLISIRVVYIQLFPTAENMLKTIAKQQYQAKLSLSAFRGNIYDRSKVPLSISVQAPSLAVNPRVFRPNQTQRNKLKEILEIDSNRLKSVIARKSYFSWLKRKVSYETADAVKKLNLRGVHYLVEPARFYPGGSSAANLLGYVGTDNIGLLGLEHAYEHTLKGHSNQLLSLKDAKGRQILLNSNRISPEKTGNNLILTIDHAIQGIAEEALEKGMRESAAKMGFALVLDPHTGRILAMANKPSFNPNNPSALLMKNTANQSISYRFEPGSTMKPFVVAGVLEAKKTTPYEIHHCEKNGRYQIARNLAIHDDHPKEFRTTEEILVQSSNICTFKLAMRVGQEGLFSTLKKFGFAGEKPTLGLPGESVGMLSEPKTWSQIKFANISFGQGLLVNGLEIAQAYAAWQMAVF